MVGARAAGPRTILSGPRTIFYIFFFCVHLTNFFLLCLCTYVVYILSHFAFEKEPAIGSKRKANNIYFAFWLLFINTLILTKYTANAYTICGGCDGRGNRIQCRPYSVVHVSSGMRIGVCAQNGTLTWHTTENF